jgi:hypothetical protein
MLYVTYYILLKNIIKNIWMWNEKWMEEKAHRGKSMTLPPLEKLSSCYKL